MYIILGDENLPELKKKYFALELETFTVEGNSKTAYCIIDPATIVVSEMQDIDRLCRLHQAVTDAWNRQDYDTVITGIGHLRGKFGGDLDSYYDTLSLRINDLQEGITVDE